jgi:uncharacterized protein
MFDLLYPRIFADSLLDIPLGLLREQNIVAFIVDLDNTITEWNSNVISLEIEAWFRSIQTQGFKACILSNNGELRIKSVADRLGIPFIHRAAKPRRGAFLRAIYIMGVTASQTAVIGDQIFTDILGGNRAGLFTILVNPIARREFLGTKINSLLELLVLKQQRRKNSTKEEVK